MKGIAFTMDFSDFDKKTTEIIKHVVPELTVKGLWNAGNEVILDAKDKPPKVPHDEGHLKATGQATFPEIERDSIATEVSFGKENPKDSLSRGGTPYARRWHEVEPGTVKFQEPGAGPKYLESKLLMFKDKYMAIIAATIKKGAK